MPHPAIIGPDYMPVDFHYASADTSRPVRMVSERKRVVQIRERCVSRQQEDARDRRKFAAKRYLPCAKPTEFLPGSKEKVALMEQRVEAGLPPCHPDDEKHDFRFDAPEPPAWEADEEFEDDDLVLE